jgi:ribulose-5-phosphate 4-epimerase/fuculose-1-phosphate aldolase
MNRPKKALFLQHHGLTTASDTFEATVFWYVSREKFCQTHLLALAAVGSDAERIVEVGEKGADKFVSRVIWTLRSLSVV